MLITKSETLPHDLTLNYFYEKLNLKDILGLTYNYNKNNFDFFWTDFQEFKKEFKIE